MKTICIALFLGACIATSYGQNCSDIIGDWVNQSGSILRIDSVAGNGLITGRYYSATGVDGKGFALTGWFNYADSGKKPLIGFSVSWGEFHSLTSWTGYCAMHEEQGPVIRTMWYYVNTDREFDWQYLTANSSDFRPMKR
jgi:hypothetical protein